MIDQVEFEKVIEEAISSLPKEFKDKLENVAVFAADWPSREQAGLFFGRGERGMLLGLYQGIPQTRRRGYGIGGPLPDKITIFKIPLLHISNTRDDLVKNIKDTVIHEIAHHFGLSDQDIKKAQSKV